VRWGRNLASRCVDQISCSQRTQWPSAPASELVEKAPEENPVARHTFSAPPTSYQLHIFKLMTPPMEKRGKPNRSRTNRCNCHLVAVCRCDKFENELFLVVQNIIFFLKRLPRRTTRNFAINNCTKNIGTQVRINIGRADWTNEHMLTINSFHCVMENYLHSRPGFFDVFVHKQTRRIVYTQVVEREWPEQ